MSRSHSIKVKDKDKLQKVRENGGYCLCAIVHDDDTKCMCKTFRETGECQCGVYEQVPHD